MSKRLFRTIALSGFVLASAGSATAWPTSADIREVGRNGQCPVALVQVANRVALSTDVTRLSNGSCRYDNIEVVDRSELGRRLTQTAKGVIFVQAWETTPYVDLMHALVTMQGAGHYNMILGNEPLPS